MSSRVVLLFICFALSARLPVSYAHRPLSFFAACRLADSFKEGLHRGAWTATMTMTMTALNTGVDGGGHAQVVHGGGDGLDGVGADDGARQVELAAAQAVAAQGHRQDGVQLQVQADVVGVGAGDAGGGHDARDAGAQAAQHIAEEDDPLGVEAGDAAGLPY